MAALPRITLRARKQAQTRLALLRATLKRLDGSRTLDEINVRELCHDAEISEASFFNYFPKKTDVLVHFIRLWSLDLAWRVRRELAGRPAHDAIETILVATAQQMREHPGLMPEIIAFQARVASQPTGELELADRLVSFPDREGIDEVPALGLDGLLPPLIDRAVRNGELPATINRRAAVLAITNVFFGVPLILARRDPQGVEKAYQQQLALVWAGLDQQSRARNKPRSRAAKTGGMS